MEPEFVLATEPPTSGQNRFALGVVVVLVAVFAVAVAIGRTVPDAATPIRIYSFLPVLAALLLANDFITATLLFGLFSIVRSHALLLIANAYLFTGLMAVLFALTFPGEFSPSGLLGAGLQTSAWIYNFWHYGPTAVIAYVIPLSVGTKTKRHTPVAISLSVVMAVALVCALIWLATAGEEFLPPIFSGSGPSDPIGAFCNFIKHGRVSARIGVAVLAAAFGARSVARCCAVCLGLRIGNFGCSPVPPLYF